MWRDARCNKHDSRWDKISRTTLDSNLWQPFPEHSQICGSVAAHTTIQLHTAGTHIYLHITIKPAGNNIKPKINGRVQAFARARFSKFCFPFFFLLLSFLFVSFRFAATRFIFFVATNGHLNWQFIRTYTTKRTNAFANMMRVAVAGAYQTLLLLSLLVSTAHGSRSWLIFSFCSCWK